MKNLQINDIITNGTNEYEVVYVSKNKERVSVEDKNGYLFSCSIKWLTNEGYTKKETPWVPTAGKIIWVLDGIGEGYQTIWENTETDQARAAFLGVYPTQEAVIKAREEFKAFRKGK